MKSPIFDAPCLGSGFPAVTGAMGRTHQVRAIYDFAGGCHMYSESGITGIDMAVQEINAAGGVLGKKLEYVKRDTEAKTDGGESKI
jgi:branched-chain amino acid transport system substrate-binding protein